MKKVKFLFWICCILPMLPMAVVVGLVGGIYWILSIWFKLGMEFTEVVLNEFTKWGRR